MGFIREREAFGMAEIFVRKFAEESLPKNIDAHTRIKGSLKNSGF